MDSKINWSNWVAIAGVAWLSSAASDLYTRYIRRRGEQIIGDDPS